MLERNVVNTTTEKTNCVLGLGGCEMLYLLNGEMSSHIYRDTFLVPQKQYLYISVTICNVKLRLQLIYLEYYHIPSYAVGGGRGPPSHLCIGKECNKHG